MSKGDIELIKGDDLISGLRPTLNELILRVRVQTAKIEELEAKLKRHLTNYAEIVDR